MAIACTGIGGMAPATVSAVDRVPPARSTSSVAARCAALYAAFGSTPRWNRLEASEGRLCRRRVREIVVGSKCAASMMTAVVDSRSSVLSPPITPARPIGPVSSVISRSSTSRPRVTESRVTSCSPGAALRTTIGPFSSDAS